MSQIRARLFTSITTVTIMSEKRWKLDFPMRYTRPRSDEYEHAHRSHFLDVLKREYIEESNLVSGHAKYSDFPNVHESTFYGTRSDAEKMGIPSVFTRFRKILSAWVIGSCSRQKRLLFRHSHVTKLSKH